MITNISVLGNTFDYEFIVTVDRSCKVQINGNEKRIEFISESNIDYMNLPFNPIYIILKNMLLETK